MALNLSCPLCTCLVRQSNPDSLSATITVNIEKEIKNRYNLLLTLCTCEL